MELYPEIRRIAETYRKHPLIFALWAGWQLLKAAALVSAAGAVLYAITRT